MKKRLLILTSLILLLAACSPPPIQTSPTTTPTTAAPPAPSVAAPTTASPADVKCQPSQALLDTLQAELPYKQAVLTQEAYAGEHLLNIWFVDPTLNPQQVNANSMEAAEHIIQAAQLLAKTSDCLSAYQILQFTVVDVEYQQAFFGPLRPDDIPPEEESNIGGGNDQETGGGKIETNYPAPTPAPNACTWTKTARKITNLLSKQDIDPALYFTRDPGGNNIFISWNIPTVEDALSIIPVLTPITTALDCLHPAPTGISITLTLPTGQTVLTGYLPATGEKSPQFDLQAFTYAIIASP